jgi:hypothetical protein
MSVFRVKLNNASQGLLDKDVNGNQITTSIQRTVYIMGPNKRNRLLKDGDTFTDCNYWKKFTAAIMGAEHAFIEVVTDDGSVYLEDGSPNGYPRVWNISADGGSTYEDNVADIIGDTGSYTVFCQITNMSSTDGDDVLVRLNGLTTAVFDLKAGQTQSFNPGELAVTLVEIDNSVSGASDVDVQVFASIASTSNS